MQARPEIGGFPARANVAPSASAVRDLLAGEPLHRKPCLRKNSSRSLPYFALLAGNEASPKAVLLRGRLARSIGLRALKDPPWLSEGFQLALKTNAAKNVAG